MATNVSAGAQRVRTLFSRTIVPSKSRDLSHSVVSGPRGFQYLRRFTQDHRVLPRRPGCYTQGSEIRIQRRRISLAALDESRKGRERVVILGSGWAGYPLASSLDHNKFQTVIISPRSYFVFTPLLAEASVGTLEFRTAIEPIRSRKTKTQFIQGWADNVSFSNKTITIEEAVADPQQGLAPMVRPGQERTIDQIRAERDDLVKKGQLFDLKYDKLVIGVGCYTQTFDTPGVKENSFFLKEPGDARQIRKRILECFETAALPTTSEKIVKQILNFAIVGGGPTGVEFAAELHDLVHEDLSKLYPDLVDSCAITVYDVAPTVLSMFEENLAKYAADTFKREGINVKTSRKIQELVPGLPEVAEEVQGIRPGLTLRVKDEEDIGIGMCVWSTGLMANPFIHKTVEKLHEFRPQDVIVDGEQQQSTLTKQHDKWMIATDEKTGSIITDDRLRLLLEPSGSSKSTKPFSPSYARDVFAIGDCAMMSGTSYPATAQVASQKATWLAKRLNKGDLSTQHFEWKNLGTMAYLGSWTGIVQGGGGLGNLSGKAAWVVWKGAYLVKSLSWRNKVLIPVYWFVNWLFGRDISRF